MGTTREANLEARRGARRRGGWRTAALGLAALAAAGCGGSSGGGGAATDEAAIAIASDNTAIVDGFNWATAKAATFVETGVVGGVVDVNERDAVGSVATTAFIPSYLAGLPYRSAFYIRDFAHQAVGAHLIGLDAENLSMLKAFAGTSTEARGWYPVWALNFDGSVFGLDYRSDTSFVREVPAPFELVERAYDLYRWTGDDRYLTDSTLWGFYEKVVSDFITAHDTDGDHVAEGSGQSGYAGLLAGLATYDESGSDPSPTLEAGDGIASEYAALRAYEAMAALKGVGSVAVISADDLYAYFNGTWGGASSGGPPGPPGASVDPYIRGYNAAGDAYTDFAKEQSWFMPLKGITAAGSKTTAYLSTIQAAMATSAAPTNIEAWTYLPDVFFRWSQDEAAWSFLEYVLEQKDVTYNSSIGLKGNYPELAYTVISQTAEGLMGIAPDAAAATITSRSHLPSAISWLSLDHVRLGSHTLLLRHDGTASSTLTHESGPGALTWVAEFPGVHFHARVDGAVQATATKSVNGSTVSYVSVSVPVGKTVTVTAE